MTQTMSRVVLLLALGAGPGFAVPTELALAVAPAATSDAPAAGGLAQVVKGVTTQADLINLFGGPNLTSRDAQGRENWVYERTVTQTDDRSATNSASGSVDFSVFWGGGQAGAGASAGQSATTLSNGSAIRTVTVVVIFGPDRTVLDYIVKANYF